jgi:DNA-binding protein H-NS
MSTLKELLAQQEALNKQIEEVRTAAVAGAIEQVRKLVAEFGLTAKDVFPGGAKAAGGKKKASGTVAIKYRDPLSGNTWTGRGKAPRWLDGKNKDDYLVK